MITLAIIIVTVLALLLIGGFILFAGGVSLLLSFGDVIIAALIIYAIVKHIWKKHHKG